MLTCAAVSGFGCDRLMCRIYLVAACGHAQVVGLQPGINFDRAGDESV
ncbi:hypothetical protein M5J15_08505 [Serratia symbiotica]|nr:hypothetical protein [Serratia symbiotica]USS94864.1 hypothetical protein M5J15_08505 [Serratia symbiotica]